MNIKTKIFLLFVSPFDLNTLPSTTSTQVELIVRPQKTNTETKTRKKSEKTIPTQRSQKMMKNMMETMQSKNQKSLNINGGAGNEHNFKVMTYNSRGN